MTYPTPPDVAATPQVRWGIRLNKFLHCRNAFVDLFIRQGALFNKTLTEVIGRMLEHILPSIDDSLHIHVSRGITFFENPLHEASNVVPSGEAVAKKKNVELFCRFFSERRDGERVETQGKGNENRNLHLNLAFLESSFFRPFDFFSSLCGLDGLSGS